MSFDAQKMISNAGISIMNETSPAAVVFASRLWVFYNGSGNDGIWYTRFNLFSWEFCTSMKSYLKDLNIRKGTSPCPVVHNDKLYVFWSNATKDGIQYTVWNGQRFEGIFDIGALSGLNVALADHTSPAAISFEGKIHVYWNGAGRDGLFFTTSNGNNDWVKQQNCSSIVSGIGVMPATSPALAVYHGSLYVFYQGSGKDGTWYFTRAGNLWTTIVSLQQRVGGNGILPDTSPSVLTLTSSDRLVLFWTGAGKDGVWYSQYRNNMWFNQQSIQKLIKTQGLAARSNCTVIEYYGEPFIFWAGLETGLWYTTRKVYYIANDELEIYNHIIRQDISEMRVSLNFDDYNVHTQLHNELIRLAQNETTITMTTPATWEAPYPGARMLLSFPRLTENRLALIRMLAEFTVRMTTILAPSVLAWQYVSSWSNAQQLAVARGYDVETTETYPDGKIVKTIFRSPQNDKKDPGEL